MNDQFIQRLSKAMVDAGMTQASLAKRLNTPQSTVQRWFNGSVPRSRMLMDICHALRCDQRWLLTGIGDQDTAGEIPAYGHRLNEEPVEYSTGGSNGGYAEMLNDSQLLASLKDCLDALTQQPSDMIRISMAETGVKLMTEIRNRASKNLRSKVSFNSKSTHRKP
jgi:transcriptional regulator with XRE-family HTH domain